MHIKAISEEFEKIASEFPLEVLEAVKQAAQEDERPINSEIVWLIRKALAARKGSEKREKSL